jgi:predicted methyltransferase
MYDGLPVPFAGIRGNAALLAQKFIGEILYEGCVAVDATAGNGYDTLFLAGAVGDSGKVFAFDVQRGALDTTAGRLKQAGREKNVVLINAGHEEMARYVTHPVDGVMFNLGYLPGGDHDIITRPDTTIKALHTALSLLKPGGRVSIVVYTGHRGAEDESNAVDQLAKNLDPGVFGVLRTTFANRSSSAPFLIFIERVNEENESLAP